MHPSIFLSASNSKLDFFHNSLYHPPIRIHVDVAASNSTKLDFFINSLYHPPIDVSASNSTMLDFFINSLSLYTASILSNTQYQ